MMPKTSVSPAAMRNSITPNCRPLRPCSSASRKVRRLPLHRALLVVGVLVVLEHRLLGLHRELAVRRLHGLEQIEVLDREVVDVVLVREIGRASCRERV